MAGLHMQPPSIVIACPDWLEESVAWESFFPTPEDRMRLAVSLARRNVEEGTGGPFGAAVFESESGRVVSAGVNVVVPSRNSVLHAEILAIMLAQQRLGSFSLRGPQLPAHDLVTSCEPCAMCLGAVFWSGVTRLICGATREDVEGIGFDEGPVFPESYRYLESGGVTVVREVCRSESREVLDLYHRRMGPRYNP
jgi:tRNA(Arg) A34 adenosine deaminase TadA